MKNKILFLSILLFFLKIIINANQPFYKIKPIKGTKSANVISENLGNGITKYSIFLERLPNKNSEIYLPSEAQVIIESNGFNPPQPSNSIVVNSSKTADGFLFIANAPQNNNLKIHLKKSSSQISSYTIEINLGKSEKYSFQIDYLPFQYLLIKGYLNNYENMISSISNNQYFKESLTFIDDELRKFSNETNLIWWAQALVGLFQDLIDVEKIGEILPSISYNFFSFESHEFDSSLFVWGCTNEKWLIILDPGEFIIINSEQSCISLSGVVNPKQTLCHFFYCPPPWDENYDSCIKKCVDETIPISVGPTCEEICDQMAKIDPNFDVEACKRACNPN